MYTCNTLHIHIFYIFIIIMYVQVITSSVIARCTLYTINIFHILVSHTASIQQDSLTHSFTQSHNHLLTQSITALSLSHCVCIITIFIHFMYVLCAILIDKNTCTHFFHSCTEAHHHSHNHQHKHVHV